MIPKPNVSIKYDDSGLFELEMELLELVEIESLFFIRVAFFAALLFNLLSWLEWMWYCNKAGDIFFMYACMYDVLLLF